MRSDGSSAFSTDCRCEIEQAWVTQTLKENITMTLVILPNGMAISLSEWDAIKGK